MKTLPWVLTKDCFAREHTIVSLERLQNIKLQSYNAVKLSFQTKNQGDFLKVISNGR